MNEQLQQALAAVLNKTVAGIEAGSAFLHSEIPDVIYQLLLWKAAVGVFWFSLLSILSGIIIVKGWELAKKTNAKADHFDKGWPIAIYGLAMAFTAIPMSLAAIENGGDALQIWIAPKIYLIEYAASLAK